MRGLLDVNVLIAMLDGDHSMHARAIDWFGAHAREGWATCPITQNGCVPIMSHPAYPNAFPARAIIERFAEATASAWHAFWPDDISLLDPQVADPGRIHGPRQFTDVYLVALAVRHGGRFVTFDGTVPLAAAVGAQRKHLILL